MAEEVLMPVVLLGGGGTGAAFAIASRLRANWGLDLRLVITDIYDAHLVTASVLADGFYTVPRADDPCFEERLADILSHEGVSTYIPILNEEINAAYRLSATGRFPNVDFWSSETQARLTDKQHAEHWLRSLGVRTPASPGDADIRFAKPRNGFGSRGTRIMARNEWLELDEAVRDDLVVQEVCSPPEVTVDSFFDCDTGEC